MCVKYLIDLFVNPFPTLAYVVESLFLFICMHVAKQSKQIFRLEHFYSKLQELKSKALVVERYVSFV